MSGLLSGGKDNDTVEVTVSVSPDVVEAIKELAKLQHISEAEAVRQAVIWHKFIVSKVRAGGKALIEEPKDKKLVELVVAD